MLRVSFSVATLCVAATVLLFSPQVFASVTISEIMYAPDGADSGREWIEVCSTGESTDISEWKLYENDTNHSLNISSGSATLASGSCAVIADNTSAFSADYPNFSGNLFDSAFSLKNTGEALQLKDSEGSVQDDVTYSDLLGAKDNGLTLHRSGSTFIEGSASPGSEGELVVDPEIGSGSSGTNTTTDITTITQYQYEALSVEPPQDIHIRLPEKVDTTAGANVLLIAEVHDARGRVVEEGRITWSFGDGATSDGRSVIHRYMHPGEYLLRAKIVRGSLFDEAIVNVFVTELNVNLLVPEHGEWVEVENKSETTLNLSGWSINTSNQYFFIPEGTYILGNTSVRFDTSVTDLTLLKMYKNAFLLFPGGTKAVDSTAPPVPFEEEVQTEILQEEPEVADLEEPAVVTVVPSDTEDQSIVSLSVPSGDANTVIQDESPKEKEKEKEEVEMPKAKPTITQQAAVSAALGEDSGSSMLLWIVGLSTLLALGVAGVIAARRNKSLADEFTITEENE